MNFIPDEVEADLRTLIECPGGAGEDSKGTDYVVYERMFTEEYLLDLYEEMKWVEENYKQDFIDSNIKRNSGQEVDDGDYANYHRVTKVYWLTFIKESDLVYLPNFVKFKSWIKLFKSAIDK